MLRESAENLAEAILAMSSESLADEFPTQWGPYTIADCCFHAYWNKAGMCALKRVHVAHLCCRLRSRAGTGPRRFGGVQGGGLTRCHNNSDTLQ